MEIGLSHKGYKTVELKCGAETMVVNLETDDEFLGVIYTRGSFYDKNSPCFYDTGNRRGQKSFELRIPFDSCHTKQVRRCCSKEFDFQWNNYFFYARTASYIFYEPVLQGDSIYSNILILQHDKELIMPGDAAFHLECDFSKPRDVIVTADLRRYIIFSPVRTKTN